MLQNRHPVDLGLGRLEEWLAESEGHRAGHHGQGQVEEVGDRPDSAADHDAGSLDLAAVGLSSRPAGPERDGGARCLRLQHTPDMVGKGGAGGIHDHMTDVASIPIVAVQQAAVQNDSAPYTGGNHHGDEVRYSHRRPFPCLGKSQRLRVVVDKRGQPGEVGQAGLEREVPPGRNVERRYFHAAAAHGASRTHAADRHVRKVDLGDQIRETGEQFVPVDSSDGAHPEPVLNHSVCVDGGQLELRATNVDCQGSLHGHRPYAAFTLRRGDRNDTPRASTLSDGPLGPGGNVTTTEQHAGDAASNGTDEASDQHGASPGFAEKFVSLTSNIELAIRGKPQAVRLLALALVSDGHVLVEDVPGVGKTSLGKALARSVDGKFGRVQFTPDLLPTDVTGVSVWDRANETFEFRPGPVFSNILLADEINRASPKTQSALLEAMGEQQVTTDGTTHALGSPFMVIATQNPIEHEGTYPLPEAQLDRFLIRIEIGYPDRAAEIEILESHGDSSQPVDSLEAVLTAEEVVEMSASLSRIYLAPALRAYLLDLADATRSHPALSLGLSPRGVLALQRIARAEAAAQGRAYATPDDVKELARFVMPHRLLITPESRMRGVRPADVVGEIVDAVPIPRPGGS